MRRIAGLCIAFAVSFAAGCGGGSDGSSSPPPPPPPPAGFTVGGVVTGLAGANGVVLRNNGGNDRTVLANGAFTFPGALAAGAAYNVTVERQPSGPTQICVVSNGTGNVGSANVTSVSVDCTTQSFNISGTVVGLTGSGLGLSNLTGAVVPIAANGAFQIAGPVLSGTPYFVRVATQPNAPTQFCSIPNGAGLVGGSDTAIDVICNSGTPRYLFVNDFLQNTLWGITVNSGTAALGATLGSPSVTGAAPADVVATPAGAFFTTAPGAFVYTRNANDGTVSGFSVNAATGALTAVPGSPFTITGQANTILRMLLSPTGRFVYFAAQNDVIYAFLIGANGALTAVPGSPFPAAAGTHWLGSDPLGRYVYGASTSPTGAFSQAYRVDPSTGALSAVGTPAAGATGIARGVVHANGQFLYVARETTAVIDAYRIDTATGQLTTAGSVNASSSQQTLPRIDPTGRFLYVPSSSGGVAGFAIDAVTGALTPVPGSPALAGTNVGQIDIDPTGRFLYAPIRIGASEGVAAFTIDATTGQLGAIVGSPFLLGFGVSPTFVYAEPSGRWLFVASFGNDLVTSFAIDAASGALTLRDSEPAGTNAASLTAVGTQ